VSAIRLRAGAKAEEVRLLGDGEASIDRRRVAYRRAEAAGGTARIEIDGRAHRVIVARDGSKIWVWCDGIARVFERAGSARTSTSGDDASDLAAPMPGRVRRILVREGEAVERGAVLLALEAMKMEHAIRAPRAGIVRRLRAAEGDLVEAGAELVELE
jgi:acetyl/propionyl-CoA carboxylase alpha subunit